jgi:polyhydroxyalkanoate synthesis regulator phasin
MPDKNPTPARPAAPAAAAPAGGTTLPVRRHPGHRGADVRDTVAEMAAKAHEISLEAGSKMAAAMKDVINAGAGLAAFSIESARDLVQFMVRRSQMTQDEADKLMASAEAASAGRKKKPSSKSSKPAKASKPAKKKPAKKPAAKK